MKFISEFRYVAAFSNVGTSKLSDVENAAIFRTFWPCVKIGGGMGEVSGSIDEALLTAELLEYIWWPLTAQLLSMVDWQKKQRKERKEKKESS